MWDWAAALQGLGCAQCPMTLSLQFIINRADRDAEDWRGRVKVTSPDGDRDQYLAGSDKKKTKPGSLQRNQDFTLQLVMKIDIECSQQEYFLLKHLNGSCNIKNNQVDFIWILTHVKNTY